MFQARECSQGLSCAVSTPPAISRVNDDAHYVSQVFLNWWLAFLAESAVDRSDRPNANYHFMAYPNPGGVGVEFNFTR